MPTGLSTTLTATSDFLFGTILVWFLLGAGIYFTIRTRVLPLRHVKDIIRAIIGSRSDARGGISSFQAFAIGLACRVGTGNIIGVALALILGGPGAIFWMWIVALLGTSTAFMEATLAQIFKVRQADHTFRGGPAYYISRGLNLKVPAAIFAVVFLIANALSMPMVQANAISATIGGATGAAPWLSAVIVVALTAPVLLGGLRAIARVTEYLAPIMAIAYLLIVLFIVLTHPAGAWNALVSIFAGAFGLRAGLSGVAGGLTAAVLNGVRRGLFSNEAGLGGAANAAGSATVDHPVQQGFIQAFGVIVDTIFICTATALAILIASPEVYTPGVTIPDAAGTLTQDAVADLLGSWTRLPMMLMIVIFAYSTILGAYSYAEVNMDYLTRHPVATKALAMGAVVCTAIGSLTQLITVWTIADILLGVGAIINIAALIMLTPWALGALRDWEKAQRRQDRDEVLTVAECGSLPGACLTIRPDAVRFSPNSPSLPARVPGNAWE
ncbi:alanine/glycine:cation symporter family protein [Actinomyces vulturis]|uniref:alanine/glycine:cation symporter family protein n=1 Tax=Actinomyces vulturis TaxID=1857645 RepID=UPI000B5AC002|nr:alanine/glycine:cation symporter family protein [Actinomyces vulturis]